MKKEEMIEERKRLCHVLRFGSA